jgi:probable HAF family extracellular repeat protein
MWITAASSAALLTGLEIATPLAAQDLTARHSGTESRYILKDLGTFGGPNSNVNGGDSHVMNNQGTVVGGADTGDWSPTCDCPVTHAFKWNMGRLTDLGTLPNGNDFSYATAINSSGTIAGVSDNGLIDPAFGELFVATVWKKNGEIVDLGTFGGLSSLPYSINDRGQLVGGAENTTPDPDNLWGGLSGLPGPTLWHAALWQNGTIQDLGTLGGPASFAYYINERGQVAGLSYTNSGPAEAHEHSFFWEHDRMVDIGTLGGDWADVSAMNNRGEVVGTSATVSGEWGAFRWYRGKMTDLGNLGVNFAGALAINDKGSIVGKSAHDDTAIRAVLWRNGVITDLGALEGHHCTVAFSINSQDQVVGQSDNECGGTDSRAWIWENRGPMVDLNTLVPAGSQLHLVEANHINDNGEIAGAGVLPNGEMHAFVLIPRKRHSDADGTASAADAAASDAASPSQSMTHGVQSPLTPQAQAAIHEHLARRHLGFSPLQHR